MSRVRAWDSIDPDTDVSLDITFGRSTYTLSIPFTSTLREICIDRILPHFRLEGLPLAQFRWALDGLPVFPDERSLRSLGVGESATLLFERIPEEGIRLKFLVPGKKTRPVTLQGKHKRLKLRVAVRNYRATLGVGEDTDFLLNGQPPTPAQLEQTLSSFGMPVLSINFVVSEEPAAVVALPPPPPLRRGVSAQVEEAAHAKGTSFWREIKERAFRGLGEAQSAMAYMSLVHSAKNSNVLKDSEYLPFSPGLSLSVEADRVQRVSFRPGTILPILGLTQNHAFFCCYLWPPESSVQLIIIDPSGFNPAIYMHAKQVADTLKPLLPDHPEIKVGYSLCNYQCLDRERGEEKATEKVAATGEEELERVSQRSGYCAILSLASLLRMVDQAELSFESLLNPSLFEETFILLKRALLNTSVSLSRVLQAILNKFYYYWQIEVEPTLDGIHALRAEDSFRILLRSAKSIREETKEESVISFVDLLRQLIPSSVCLFPDFFFLQFFLHSVRDKGFEEIQNFGDACLHYLEEVAGRTLTGGKKKKKKQRYRIRKLT